MRFHHVAMISSDLNKSAEFYGEVLALELDVRPDLGFSGLFYKLGNGQQLHLMRIDNPYDGYVKPEHGGRDHHVALVTDDLDVVLGRLKEKGINYTQSRSGRVALFCRDPDGYAIEILQQP